MYRPEATSYSLDSPESITLDVHHRTIRRMPWGHWTLEPVRKLKCTSGTQGLSLVTPVNHGQPWMMGGCITCSPWQIGKWWWVSGYPWRRRSEVEAPSKQENRKCQIHVSYDEYFLELSCFFGDTADVGNLISGSSALSKTNLNIWKFTVHVLLKPGLENFEHYLTSVWDECNCCLQILTIVHKAAINICVQVFVWTEVFSSFR